MCTHVNQHPPRHVSLPNFQANIAPTNNTQQSRFFCVRAEHGVIWRWHLHGGCFLLCVKKISSVLHFNLVIHSLPPSSAIPVPKLGVGSERILRQPIQPYRRIDESFDATACWTFFYRFTYNYNNILFKATNKTTDLCCYQLSHHPPYCWRAQRLQTFHLFIWTVTSRPLNSAQVWIDHKS